MISAGVEALGSLGSLGYTQVVTESQGVMKLNRLDFKDERNLLFKYFQEIKQVSPIDLPQEEYKGWTHPYKNGIPIVKKMPSELSKKYLYKRMPKVYDALNSYGSTAFAVNEELLDIVKDFDFVKLNIDDIEGRFNVSSFSNIILELILILRF